MANMDRWQEHIGPLDDLTLSQLKRAKNIFGAFIKSVDKEYNTYFMDEFNTRIIELGG